jgi:hypothetical protein
VVKNVKRVTKEEKRQKLDSKDWQWGRVRERKEWGGPKIKKSSRGDATCIKMRPLRKSWVPLSGPRSFNFPSIPGFCGLSVFFFWYFVLTLWSTSGVVQKKRRKELVVEL